MESGVARSQGRAGSSKEADSTTTTPWRPRQLAFRPYVPPRRPSLAEEASGSSSGSASFHKTSALRVIVKKPVVLRLTKDIIKTYQICNPNFKHSEAFKRFLTSPHVGAANRGRDNVNADLILSVNHVLVNEASQRRYIVKELLGQGTFGQVVKCLVADNNNYVAVKVIKNLAAYYNQALYEVNILRTLNQRDPDDNHHIVRMFEYFVCESHLCISFEVLGSNLYELLKMNQLKGLSLGLVQMFSKQILVALVATKDAGIIHCDLKPENILLSTSIKPPKVKVIDFGSACKEGQTVYSYIQSRYYRSPEVLLGYPYTTAVDMWSFGCIVAELFLGLPLFPGASEYDLLRRMLKIIGGQPPDNLLRNAKNTNKYFKHIGSIHHLDYHDSSSTRPSAYKLLTELEIEVREQKKPAIGKWYFSSVKLEDIIAEYPYKKNLSEEEIHKEMNTRLALVDFVRGLVEFDPEKRWTPLQASGHPFVTGEVFLQPYNPPRLTPCIAVSRNIMVDHDPGRGHFVATGLSPQVSDMNRSLRHHSPHFPMVAFSQGGNYGSLGSYGSYGSFGEQSCFRGSYGSYGDHNSMHAYYSPAGPSGLGIPLHVGRSSIASSPDTRSMSHYPYGPGIGISPTGSFGPMSLGVSPSQFTPPGSQMPVLGNSPGKYGPTSPARAGSYGSPLGKAAAVGQYNKRRHSGLSGTFPAQSLESTCQQWQGHCPELSNYSDGGSGGHVRSPSNVNSIYNQPNWANQRDLGNLYPESPLTFHQTPLSSHAGNSDSLHSSEADLSESSSFPLNPGDWDPNYSDELLLQESSDVSTIASGINNLRLGSLGNTVGPTAFDLNSGSDKGQEVRVEGISHRSSNARSSSSAVQNIYIGNSYPSSGSQVRPHFWQATSSDFSQHPLHQSLHFLPTSVCGDRILTNGQFRPNYPVADSHSLSSNAFGSKTWGQRAVHPIVATVPSTHARDDYGRIV